MSGANNEARRRLSDLIASGECGKGQHVLYNFLLELDGLTAKVDKLDGLPTKVDKLDERVGKIETGNEAALKAINDKLEKLQDDQAPLRVVMWAWEKLKSAGLVAVLIGWLFQDQPTVAAIIKALTH